MDKFSLLTAKNRRLCKIITPDRMGGVRKIPITTEAPTIAL